MSIKLKDICKIVDNVAIIVSQTRRSLSATYLLGKKSIRVKRERDRQTDIESVHNFLTFSLNLSVKTRSQMN
jgi:hypothetical protein